MLKKIRDIILDFSKHLNQQTFIFILSIILGICGGISAVVLKTLVHYVEIFLTHELGYNSKYAIYFAFPLIGIFFTVLFIKKVIKQDISHGITKILYAISKNRGNIDRHNMWSSIVGCSITSGFGGSVGMEAPIVYTGSSIGSNLGQIFRLSHKSKILLIGCGAAASIAGIFKAPVTGVVFTLEILMLDLTTSSIVPLLISAVCGALVSSFFLGDQILFNFTITRNFVISDTFFYAILAILTGLFSLYFSKMIMNIENQLKKIRNSYYRLLIGGSILGLLIFLLPPLFGEGYITLKAILTENTQELISNSVLQDYTKDNWALILFLSLTLLYKPIATALTTGSGGVGGIFAPTLFVGGILGFLFAKILNTLYPELNICESNFSLAGMAGSMAGVMHAPLTAIFLIAEITGGYELFIPLMLVSSISFFTVKMFQTHSIYTQTLAKSGALITHNKDKAVLTLLSLDKIIEKDFIPVPHYATLGDMIPIIKKSHRNLFPVVDFNNVYLGTITLDEIREIMFDKELYNKVYVLDLMVQAPVHIYTTDSMETVMKKFQESGFWNLPVIDSDKKFIGYVSKANIFSAYRNKLMEFSDD